MLISISPWMEPVSFKTAAHSFRHRSHTGWPESGWLCSLFALHKSAPIFLRWQSTERGRKKENTFQFNTPLLVVHLAAVLPLSLNSWHVELFFFVLVLVGHCDPDAVVASWFGIQDFQCWMQLHLKISEKIVTGPFFYSLHSTINVVSILIYFF